MCPKLNVINILDICVLVIWILVITNTDIYIYIVSIPISIAALDNAMITLFYLPLRKALLPSEC